MQALTQQDIVEILSSRVDDSITSWDQLPEPYQFLGMREGVDTFIRHVNAGSKILFIHDSDADGLGTYVLSYIFFQHFLYPNIEVIITDRHQGYGFIPKHMDDRISSLPSVIITADNGITAISACLRAKELGIDVIITDHHQVDSIRGKPDAIIIDPHQEGCPFPYKDINGTFVYWYFLKAIAEVSGTKIDMINEFKPELALTTISDVMPLNGINRFVVKEGLKAFDSHHRQWVRTFFKVFAKSKVTAEDLSFNLIPAINVTSRLTNAEESAIFLTQHTPEGSLTWLKYIQSLNDVRKKKQEQLMKDINGLYSGWLEAPFILIPGENFEKGILGPTAGRIAERLKKPTIVLTKNQAGTIYSGSGRSTGSIDLLELVKNNPHVIQDKTGGHKAACGISFPVEKLNDVWYDLQMETHKLHEDEYKDVSKEFLGLLELRNIDYELLDRINDFQPFGQKFQKPMFVCRAHFKKVTKIGKEKNHYSIELEDGLGCSLRAVWFFFTDELKSKTDYNFIYSIAPDDYNKKEGEALCLHVNAIISDEEWKKLNKD